MQVTVDARGLPCPQPVILTRKAMSEADAGPILTIVDSHTAQHNVSRMAAREGYSVEVQERPDGIYVLLKRSETVPLPEPQADPVRSEVLGGQIVLLVAGDQIGRGPLELGQLLMRSFMYTLGDVEPKPGTLIFINEGVRLVVVGSPVLDDMRELVAGGVEVLACGTCLEFFGLRGQLAVGEVSNMYTIAETLLRAGKIVTL